MSSRSLPVLEQPEVVACCSPLQSSALADVEAAELSRRFAALSDPVRLRLLSLLANADGGAVCACDLVGPLGKSQPTVSHHLRVLREAGLITSEKRGVNVWYATVPAAIEALRTALAGG
jgi:ArsR family transcriptional regulator